MQTHTKAPMAEMFIKYWMFPYQVNESKSPDGSGDGEIGAMSDARLGCAIGPNHARQLWWIELDYSLTGSLSGDWDWDLWEENLGFPISYLF